ncbi:unnamed protein product [Gongylonema pulchrum]|uniref:Acyl_transf_3 domain-containing protein n=1 Tax=Gongylonema pulchrum TaxID=637853 RepID=A0A183DRX1_9BILA|nr:unnamed protein product [Gongylonema pulchrum]
MSLPVWVPFGRLSYCMYLTHLVVMMYIAGMGAVAFKFSDSFHTFVTFALPCCVLTCFFAYCLSVLFEIPAGKVEMVFLEKGRGRTLQQHQQKTHTDEQQLQIPETSVRIDKSNEMK